MGPTKMCEKGHVLDASWDRCPYCPAAQPKRAAVPPTVFGISAPAAAPLAKPNRQTVIRAEEQAKEKAKPIVGWLLVLSGARKGEDFRIREGRNAVGSAPENDIV